MKKFFTVLILMLAFSFTAFSQTQDEKDALGVVNTMFTEMANFNPAGIVPVFTPEAQLVAIIKGKDGKNKIEALTREAFSKFFAEKQGTIKEVMYAPDVKVDGDLAIISGRYVFFADGKLLHCGTDAFHLVRTEAGWKIANASSTIDPARCTDQEKAMKP